MSNNTKGFFDIPSEMMEGAILHQFIVEMHSLRMDFGNGLSILTQTAIKQTLPDGTFYTYDIESHSDRLVLEKYLGLSVQRQSVVREDELELHFEGGGSIALPLSKARALEAVTIFSDGLLEYALA